MVKNVEQYTSMPEPEIKEHKLSALLQNSINNWGKKYYSEKIQIKVKSLPEDSIVFIDMELMTIALTNILQNSKEAMPEGGVVLISTWLEGKWMVISVKDNGQGISQKDLPLLFDPFFTSKTYGSGLGLTIVNRIVSGHSGEVKIFSTPGEGTEVKIYFPLFFIDELS